MPESNLSTEPRFVVGRLGRPHGLDGYLGLYVDESDVVYFQPHNTVVIRSRPYTVRAVRRADRGYQVRFEGIDSRRKAEEIRGSDVEVVERRSLDADEFWPEDLVGLKVKVSKGLDVGVVSALVSGAAQDRLVVDIGSERYEVPFVTEFVPVVDIEAGYVEIQPIPGLIEPLA